MAVVLLTWLQSVPSVDLGFLGRTSGATTSFIICVWMLLPIGHSQDVEALFKSAFKSGITAAVSIFTIKLSLALTNLVTDAVFGALTNLLPFEFPERLQQLISSVINVGAEVFFVTVLLGYAWSRTRQQFMRL
jgi:ABC-type Fe3+-siderophore transport system permease subunit